MNGQPTRVSQLFPSKWLSAADLPHPVTATISKAAVRELRQQDGSMEQKLVVTFERASKEWILNKTQATALAEALGDMYGDWPGARVKLAAGRAQNGKDTIVVVEATKLPDRVLKEMPAPPAPPAPPPADPKDPDPDLWKQ